MENEPLVKLNNFFSQFSTLSYKKGDIIFRADDNPNGIFYLKKGFVRSYSISSEGNELTLNILEPGEFFPVTWVSETKPNLYYFEALTQVEVLRAPREKVMNFLRNNPDVHFRLMDNLAANLNGLLNRIEYMVFGNAYKRVALGVLLLTYQFGKKEGDYTVIQERFTHRDIANLAGITRETASLEMEKLMKKGVIAYQGRTLIVKSVKLLEKESSFNNLN